MNDAHYVCEEVDRLFLKDESLDNDGRENSNTCDLQSKKSVFHETQAKCGDIFVGWQGNFTLVCSICSEEIEAFDSFCLHIEERHLVNELGPETPVEPYFTESLPLWDATYVPPSSIRENAKRTKKSTQTHLESEVKASQPAVNCSIQANQLDVISGAKQVIDIWEQAEELDEKISGGEYTPEKEASSISQTLRERKEYFCIYCGRMYVSKKSFIAHSKKEHNNDRPTQNVRAIQVPKEPIMQPVKMVCKYCDKSFDDHIEFKNHSSTHVGRSRFVCPFCPKTFVTRYNRKMHINTHTGERPFKCTHCPKAFSHATNLEMHTRMHLKIMKFACDYCGKRFIHSTEKKHHERIHTGEKPYQCEECGKQFIAHVKLMEHSRRHKNIKNYKCDVCTKAFYTSSALKNHMPTHTGERPHQCNICSQTFPRRGSLRAHQQLHSKEKKYVCDVCGKAFSQFAGLYSHRKSHGRQIK